MLPILKLHTWNTASGHMTRSGDDLGTTFLILGMGSIDPSLIIPYMECLRFPADLQVGE